MKKVLCLSLSAIFMFGILFPVSHTSEGKSPFIEQIKKVFGYSTGVTGTEGTKRKGAMLHGEGESGLFQGIRDIFHYFPGDVERPKIKKYPLKLDKALEKEFRYPHKEETK